MRTVVIHLHARGIGPAETYARISDFARYPSMVETVREVVVGEPDSDGSVLSAWTVRFRSGLLQWTERGYLEILAAQRGERVRAEPFVAVEMPVGVLFGDDEEDFPRAT